MNLVDQKLHVVNFAERLIFPDAFVLDGVLALIPNATKMSNAADCIWTILDSRYIRRNRS